MSGSFTSFVSYSLKDERHSFGDCEQCRRTAEEMFVSEDEHLAWNNQPPYGRTVWPWCIRILGPVFFELEQSFDGATPSEMLISAIIQNEQSRSRSPSPSNSSSQRISNPHAGGR